MNLLFDQNISYKVARMLSSDFADCKHVYDLNLTDASDDQIWMYAKQNKYCIVTFDSDFLNLATLKGSPPKVILMRTGNRKTFKLAEILRSNSKTIQAFMEDSAYEDVACLEINE